MTCWSLSPPAASLLRIPCELVLDMAFVPALQDPGSHERQELLHSFNETVSAGWGQGVRAGGHRAQLPPPCAGHSPLRAGAWVPAAGGDRDQVGDGPVPQCVTLPSMGLQGLSHAAGPQQCRGAVLGRASGTRRLAVGVPAGRAAWCCATMRCWRRSSCRCRGWTSSSRPRWALPVPSRGWRWARPPSCATRLWVSAGLVAGRAHARQGGVAQLDPVPAVRPLDLCAVLFACPSGFACVSRADGNVTCTSLCHRDYCKNHGICTHARDQQPRCQ